MCLSFINNNDNSQQSCVPDDLKSRLNTVKVKGNIQTIQTYFKQLKDREASNNQMIQQLE